MTSSSPVARLFTTLPRKTIPKAQKSLPDAPVPLLYHPKESRKQNTQVTIPGTTRQEVLVLNDTVNVTVQAAEQRTDNWCLGYALTVHSSQGLTIKRKVWIIDDYLQWSNLAYLAVSRVEYLDQLQRVCPPVKGTEFRRPTQHEVRKNIQKKLVAYKRQDQANGRAKGNLKVDYILKLKEDQQNSCAKCKIEML